MGGFDAAKGAEEFDSAGRPPKKHDPIIWKGPLGSQENIEAKETQLSFHDPMGYHSVGSRTFGSGTPTQPTSAFGATWRVWPTQTLVQDVPRWPGSRKCLDHRAQAPGR